ncbi:hypothetical protein BDN72DRAFT_896149 [Pluteus cervinus]|uniref:Uncharacterized protein n=1 Tax=Pluteus cervinus TaxID=181527 RepID=A0ACD3AYK6_9AGAR|nr:hypothetical protein BDN72DRAFT_896149 [Pluteus cervinus]
MKLSLAASTFVALALAGMTNAAALAGAGVSCTNWIIVPNTADVAADCRTADGGFQHTQIALSKCLGNGDGNPGCTRGGGAGESCVFSNIYAIYGNPVVSVNAQCKRRDGSINTIGGLDIGTCLTNSNGILSC